MVHKGEMIASDGIVKAVAIKTIKCELLCKCVLVHEFIQISRKLVHILNVNFSNITHWLAMCYTSVN